MGRMFKFVKQEAMMQAGDQYERVNGECQTSRGNLRTVGIAIIAGPVPRTGARGTRESVYVRDPDGNLVEVARYPEGGS